MSETFDEAKNQNSDKNFMDMSNSRDTNQIDFDNDRFPYSIVWCPIPLITWLIPIIGHMGICYSNGVIRDFAGPYVVTEDNMAFGRPTRYWRLNPEHIPATNGAKREIWDRSVKEASDEYKMRVHNLFCDNCHSHVAYALNLMNFENTRWNMVNLCFLMAFKGRFVNFAGFLKTWIPFLILCGIIAVIALAAKLS